jgi:hypothetical protein
MFSPAALAAEFHLLADAYFRKIGLEADPATTN